MRSDFSFPRAPRTIDWAALFISLIFAHPSAMLFLYLLCQGAEGPAYSPVVPVSLVCPCGFGTVWEDTSLPSSSW